MRGSVGTGRLRQYLRLELGSKLFDLKAMLATLGPEYVTVTPSQLNALSRQAHATK